MNRPVVGHDERGGAVASGTTLQPEDLSGRFGVLRVECGDFSLGEVAQHQVLGDDVEGLICPSDSLSGRICAL